jgi:hypothetical protein
MENWHFWVPIGISLAALVFSAASWWHNLSAHGERRFGDIVSLRSTVSQRLTTIQERLHDAYMALHATRFRLRHLPDSDENKYDWIEEAPAHAKAVDEYIEEARNLRWSIEKLPANENSSHILRKLQLLEHEVGVLEHGADKLTRVTEAQDEALDQHDRRVAAEREARFEELARLARVEEKSLEPPET